MKTKLFPILLALSLLLCGCTSAPAEPEAPTPTDFAAAGMHLTLTDAFTEKQHVSYTAMYHSDEVAVMVLKEEYTLFDNTEFSSQTSPEQYAALVWSSNQFQGEVPLQADEDLTWFEYDRTVNGTDYRYRAYVYKSNEAFWLFQFAVRSEAFSLHANDIHSYAASVYFDTPYLSSLPEISY